MQTPNPWTREAEFMATYKSGERIRAMQTQATAATCTILGCGKPAHTYYPANNAFVCTEHDTQITGETLVDYRDTTHDSTRKTRLLAALSKLNEACPPYKYMADDTLFFKFSNTMSRVGAHISDCGWGVRLTR